jgi:copper oxidase (laccase) domain-containing protein
VAEATSGGTAPARVGTVHWSQQVHGAGVSVIPAPAPESGDEPGGAGVVAVWAGPGDALVTATPSVALAVLTADCASIALGSPEGIVGAVHAGWRGLLAGVVEEAVAAMSALGATQVVGALGPCIHSECYEFSAEDLDRVADRLGEGVRARTGDGRPALDLPAAVSAGLERAGARLEAGDDGCTACGGGYFSHRARGDLGRQALVVWASPAATPR